jgi:hypothetical protein
MLCTRYGYAAPMFGRTGPGMRAAFDLRAARPYRGRQARFRRTIEIEGGPRLVMSYDARVFISSPQEKATRLLEAAETGERENIDRLQALDLQSCTRYA